MEKLILLGTVLFFATNLGKAQNSISGYIVSLETAKPIANATVFLNNRYGLPLENSLRVRSDSTGFYKIHGIKGGTYIINARSEEHTSELQSRGHLVCRLLL